MGGTCGSGQQGLANREVAVCLCLGSSNHHRTTRSRVGSWEHGSHCLWGTKAETKVVERGSYLPLSTRPFPFQKTSAFAYSCMPTRHRLLLLVSSHGRMGALGSDQGRNPRDGGG